MTVVVGSVLAFFGREGIRVAWWREDLSRLALIAVYGLASLIMVHILMRRERFHIRAMPGILPLLRVAVREVCGLFADDGALALATLAALVVVAAFSEQFTFPRGVAAVLLVVGVLGAVTGGVSGALKQSRPARARADAPNGDVPRTPATETEAPDRAAVAGSP